MSIIKINFFKNSKENQKVRFFFFFYINDFFRVFLLNFLLFFNPSALNYFLKNLENYLRAKKKYKGGHEGGKTSIIYFMIFFFSGEFQWDV